MISYARFCQSLHLVVLLLRYKSARSVFPTGRNSDVACLQAMIGFMARQDPPQHQQVLEGPVSVVAACLADLLAWSSHARTIVANFPQLAEQLLIPLRSWSPKQGSPDSSKWGCCQLLSELLRISGRVGLSSEVEEVAAASSIVDFCCMALDRHQEMNNKTKLAVANLAGQVTSSKFITVSKPNFFR